MMDASQFKYALFLCVTVIVQQILKDKRLILVQARQALVVVCISISIQKHQTTSSHIRRHAIKRENRLMGRRWLLFCGPRIDIAYEKESASRPVTLQ